MRHIAILAVVLLASVALAKPTNPNAKPEPPKAPLKSPSDLAMERMRAMEGSSNWGFIVTDGRAFTIQGHHVWSATGYVRADGGIVIQWTLNADGSLAPGLYQPDADKGISGFWGHAHDTRIDDDGKLVGNVRPDRIVNVEPPVPDF